MTNSGSSPERSRDGALEQRRLSRAGRADEIERHNFATREPCSTFGGDRVVLRENARFQVDATVGILVSLIVIAVIVRMRVAVIMAVRMALLVPMMMIMSMLMFAMKMTVAMVPMRMAIAVRIMLGQRRDLRARAGLQIGHRGPLPLAAAARAHYAASSTSMLLMFSSSPRRRWN